MAILDALPGVSVSISVNGADFIRYIEAFSDINFAFELKVPPPFKSSSHHITFNIEAVGKIVRRARCDAKCLASGSWTYTVQGVHIAQSTHQHGLSKFYFASVKSIEDDDMSRIERDIMQVAPMGELAVRVFHMTAEKRTIYPKKFDLPAEDVNLDVAEKAIKGKPLSHHTSLRAFVASKRHTRFLGSKYVDGEDKPLAVFIFRYLSKEALQQLLIIPRTSSPDPLDALTAEEIKALARERYIELQASSQRVRIKSDGEIKRDVDEDMKSSLSRVSTAKQNRHSIKIEGLPSGNETIDLTDERAC